MVDYDAVIVGAGHNALVCAIYLAKAGMKVGVFEGSSAVGGALRSASLTLPGFVHDLYATNVSQFAVSPTARDFATEFESRGIKFLTGTHSYASAYVEANAVRVFLDAERTEKEIASKAPGDLLNWRKSVNMFRHSAPHLLPLFFMPLPSGAAIGQLARLVGSSPADVLRLWHIARQSVRDFVDQRFQSPEISGLFVPWAYHMDFGPDVPGGAMFAYIAAMSGHLRGLSVAAGGAGRISDALHDIAIACGVTVTTQAEVAEILVEGGHAVGVKLKSGGTIRAKLVVAGVTPRNLFGALIAENHLPASFRRRIAKFRYGPSTFIIHLALDNPLDWRAADDLWRFNYVHICGEIEQVARTYCDCASGILPERPVLVVSQTTSVDPSRAPPGHHVARIHVRTVPFTITGDSSRRIHARDWKQASEPFADRMIDLLEEHAPNVRKATVARHIVTPVEIQADNPNLVEGDCVSGSHHLDQNYFNRPIRGWSRYETPIRGLYMTGASTWPGGGVHGGSGYLLAQQLLR